MKTVVVTPAGRQKYLELLARHIINDPEVDRWDLWLNTEHQPDVKYINSLPNLSPKIRVVTVPDPIPPIVAYRIHKFYAHTTEPNTVYIRMDDDIVYYKRGSIARLAEKRLEHRHPFLVYGNVLNTAITSHLHQRHNRLSRELGIVRYQCMDGVGWGNPKFAEHVHRSFVDNHATCNGKQWLMDDWWLYDYERHSVNVVSWLGEECAEWHRTMSHDEEAWLASEEPKRRGRCNMICGDGIFVHFAFYTQREHMDKTDILSQYARLAP